MGALHSADALILPSHQENYGMVVAEACSVGTPVIHYQQSKPLSRNSPI